MINNIINKLNIHQYNYCSFLSMLIEREQAQGLKENLARNQGKLIGYLDSLEELQVITAAENKELYNWFSNDCIKTKDIEDLNIEKIQPGLFQVNSRYTPGEEREI